MQRSLGKREGYTVGFVALLALILVPTSRADEAVGVGAVRLRGGIDANPTLLPRGRASPLAGFDGAFAIGREHEGLRTGLVGEVERTDYPAVRIDPSERYRLALEAETTSFESWSLRSGSAMEAERSATLRALDVVQRLRVQWTGDAWRPFLAAEFGYHTLNETNAIFRDFLPDDQRFGRVTLTPGVTLALGRVEIGASVALSATRYAEAIDVFGYRRENERIQPFAFARYEEPGLAVSGSVSRLYGFWHDVDFSRVNELLFDVSLARSAGSVTLELGALRTAGETSFPISPITVTDSRLARLSFHPDERWSFGALARSLRTRYLDSPFSTETFGYGGLVTYALSGGWTIGAELLRLNAVALNGERADGGLAMLSIGKRVAVGSGGERWARGSSPTAARLSPRSLTSTSLSSLAPSRGPYQPP